MSLGSFRRADAATRPLAEINVTPLVDVMLVLLVIFLITAPLLTAAIRIDLPATDAPVSGARAEAIQLSIAADGAMHWNREPLGRDELVTRLRAAAARAPQPELHLRADRATRYETLADLMALAQDAGLARVGFVTEPRSGAGPAPAR